MIFTIYSDFAYFTKLERAATIVFVGAQHAAPLSPARKQSNPLLATIDTA